MQFGFRTIAGALAAAFLALSSVPAGAIDFTNIAFVQTASGPASIPVGHAEFCARLPGECRPHAEIALAVRLDENRWNQLLAINAHYNRAIVPVTDKDLYGIEEYWTYPKNGYGDCEDIALAKRRALIEAGWPASTLLMTVVRERDGNGHAVLTVRTDRGDLVLDNQEGLILLWSETPYQFVKRQDQAHAGRWVDMIDERHAVVTVTASH